MALVKAFASLTALFLHSCLLVHSSVPQLCKGRPRKMIEDPQAQAGDLVIGLQPSQFCWQLSVSLWAMAHFCYFCPWCPSFLGPCSAFGLCWVEGVWAVLGAHIQPCMAQSWAGEWMDSSTEELCFLSLSTLWETLLIMTDPSMQLMSWTDRGLGRSWDDFPVSLRV